MSVRGQYPFSTQTIKRRESPDRSRCVVPIHKKNPAAVDEFYAAANHARLLAGDGVLAAIDTFTETWQDALVGDSDEADIADAKKDLIEAMRDEQNRLLVAPLVRARADT